MPALTWKRDGRGRQVSTCGRYAVEADGYARGAIMYEGTQIGDGGEWAAILVVRADGRRVDENLDWYPTMREAKAHCQRDADAAERFERQRRVEEIRAERAG